MERQHVCAGGFGPRKIIPGFQSHQSAAVHPYHCRIRPACTARTRCCGFSHVFPQHLCPWHGMTSVLVREVPWNRSCHSGHDTGWIAATRIHTSHRRAVASATALSASPTITCVSLKVGDVRGHPAVLRPSMVRPSWREAPERRRRKTRDTSRSTSPNTNRPRL